MSVPLARPLALVLAICAGAMALPAAALAGEFKRDPAADVKVPEDLTDDQTVEPRS